MRLNINHLRLKFTNAAGHEHRVRPVTRRVLELLRVRLRNELLASGARLDSLRLETLSLPALNVNLRFMDDEAVAEKVADAMYTALRARWQEN